MSNQKKREDLSPKIKIALDKAIQKIIAEEKARDGYLVVSDSNGNIKKIPAKDLSRANIFGTGAMLFKYKIEDTYTPFYYNDHNNNHRAINTQ